MSTYTALEYRRYNRRTYFPNKTVKGPHMLVANQLMLDDGKRKFGHDQKETMSPVSPFDRA